MSETDKDNGEGLEVVQPSALEALQRADVDIQITTAKKYPRDIARAIKTVRELALRNLDVAARCNYAVPRGGKNLVGPSVHFARIVAHAWCNLRFGSRVLGCDRDNAHLQGVCHDLESNTAISLEMDWPVQGPHKDTPDRWKDQMFLAKRGGGAVAMRNAIFEVVPLVLFEQIAREALVIAVGEGKTFEERRGACIAEFKKLGVSQAQIYKFLDRGGLEAITTDDLIYLHGILTSLLDRTTSVQEVFGPQDSTVKAQVPKKAQTPEEPPAAADKGLDLAKKMKEEVASAAASAAEPTKQPAAPPAPAEPAEEPKPAEAPKPKPKAPKKEPITKGEAPSPQQKIRAKLAEAGETEAHLIQWLDDLGTVADGTVSLDTVNQKWLGMILDDWPGIMDQMQNFLTRKSAPTNEQS